MLWVASGSVGCAPTSNVGFRFVAVIFVSIHSYKIAQKNSAGLLIWKNTKESALRLMMSIIPDTASDDCTLGSANSAACVSIPYVHCGLLRCIHHWGSTRHEEIRHSAIPSRLYLNGCN